MINEIADHATSRQTDRHEGFETLEAHIRARAVDVILLESLDRLSRRAVDLPRIFELAHYNRVELHTLDKGRVTNLDVGVAGLLNPIQIEQIVQRTHHSLEQQVVKEGKSADGLSYGYRIPVGHRGLRMAGELVILEAEAAVVLRIFREYEEGRTPREIAHGLNKDGIRCPASGKREGTAHWGQSTIQGNRERGTGTLNNELYVGRRVWNRLEFRLLPDTCKRVSRLRDPSEHKIAEVPHLRIVPDELWAAAKAHKGAHDAKRAERPAKDPEGLSQSQSICKVKYLHSGLLRCGRCGGYLTIAGSGEKRYHCSDARQKGPAVCRVQPGTRQDEAEQRVLAGLQRHLLTDAAYAAFKARVDAEVAR